ncbi:cytochrome c oxidase subunit 2A [Paenibacillus mesotrionivorans]|uniref:Cytochrome c oxidase subunit 2A n=1 Tax=Paenibacillus mesotrionivorans TaxID=3160968 RepID=A0ACC7P1E8_9BACL
MTDFEHSEHKPGQAADNNRKQVSLKGTFVSVMLLGGFLALTWLLVFILFLSQNG